VDHDSPSWNQWRAYERAGRHSRANLVWRIAREPKAVWVGRFTKPNFHVKVRRIFENAHAQGAVPIMTVLRAQSTRCSPTYDGGGPAEDARTRAWYDDLARAIGLDRVVIAFEPDSLGTIDCHARSRRDDRYRLLRYGVTALSRNPNATIYIEAGASDWEGASRMAKKLRRVGVAKVRGFMLNATHYDWTRSNIRYGLKLSRLVGGKHFIVNTAENGRGPIHHYLPNGRRITVWCNPPNRGLGPAPTTTTSNSGVDAYMWVNRPGYAQSCQHRPIAWYSPRALSYARYATSWEAPPPGTKNGFKVRR
jgi:endoglucanase